MTYLTIHQRAIRYAERYPGKTATEIANALRESPATVSKALYRAWLRNQLIRWGNIHAITYEAADGSLFRVRINSVSRLRFPLRYFSYNFVG